MSSNHNTPYERYLEPSVDGSTFEDIDMQQAIRASLQDVQPDGNAKWAELVGRQNYLAQRVDSSEIANDMPKASPITQQALNGIMHDSPNGQSETSNGVANEFSSQPDTKVSDLPLHKRVKSSSSPKQVNWITMMENVERRIARELPTLQVPDGDTYIYIDPPPQEPEQDLSTYQWIRDRYRRPLCMKKNTLLALNSPFFNKALGPSEQYRLIRRRGLVNRLPPQIKYVLNLTPPNEGNEAVILCAELSCSEGVRNWVLASKRWNISTQLVGGSEDYRSLTEDPWSGDHTENTNANPSVSPNSESLDTKGNSALQDPIDPEPVTPNNNNAQPALKRKAIDDENEEIRIPLEYTAIRHRLAIERVLLAIAGLDPKLDSAPKVWTTFAVAKYFEIRDISLTDYIVRWLRAAPNTCFLEVLPETSLKMADGLQNWDLCRDTFALLVGEEALASACQGHETPAMGPHRTVHGRKKDEVPESYQTRIEYASKAFRERITGEFDHLVNSEMRWVESLDEFTKLSSYVNLSSDTSRVQSYNEASKQLKQTLKTFLQGAIYRLLGSDYDGMPGPLNDRNGGDILFPRTPFRRTWSNLVCHARILTRSFWQALEGIHIQDIDTNFGVGSKYGYKPSNNYDRRPGSFTALMAAGTFRHVERKEIEDQIMRCYILYGRNSFSFSFEQNDLNRVDNATTSFHMSKDHLPVNTQVHFDKPISLPIREKVDRWEETLNANNLHKMQKSTPIQPKEKSKEVMLPRDPAFRRPFQASKREEQQAEDEFTRLVSEPDPPILTPRGLTTNEDLPFRAFHDKPFSERSYSRIIDPAGVNAQPPKYSDIFPASSTYSQLLHLKDHDPTTQISFFNLSLFLTQAENYLADVSRRILQPPRVNQLDPLELTLTNTLVCLSDTEWKYLPLWAGGNDDGSGGVFNDDVPIAETGFSAAGPNVHTGSSMGSSRASSEFELVGSQGSGSTYHTSTVVHDGYSDDVDRRRVYDDDSVWGDVMASRNKSVADSSHTVGGEDVSMDGDSSWEEIMTPGASVDGDDGSVMHIDKGKGKIIIEEIDGSVMHIDKGKAKVAMDEADESFDDVFMGESDEDEFDDADDDYDDDDDDNEDNTDYNSDRSGDERDERMTSGKKNEHVVYREDPNDKDAFRP